MPLAPVAIAQAAPDSIANTNALPLKNLQIEVRQVQREDRQRDTLAGRAEVQVSPDGSLSVAGGVQGQNSVVRQSTTAAQQVLVLNGRSAHIALRMDTPVRLVQTFMRNGVLLFTQGTVVLQRGTGFMATPRWDGSQQLELELSAQQALRATAPGQASSSTSSVLVLPLGEWVTVAQSEQQSNDSHTGSGGSLTQTTQTSTDVQVRVTVR